MKKKRIFGVSCCLKTDKKKIKNNIKIRQRKKHQTKTVGTNDSVQ